MEALIEKRSSDIRSYTPKHPIIGLSLPNRMNNHDTQSRMDDLIVSNDEESQGDSTDIMDEVGVLEDSGEH
jgi:hypothetical protein